MAVLMGSAGADRIRTAAAGGSVSGTTGVFVPDATGSDIIFAGEGNDTVEPGPGWNAVYGQGGDDRIVLPGGGNAWGEAGDDTISLLAGGFASGGSGADSLAGSGAFYVTLNGDIGADTLVAGDGGALMMGGGDNDVLLGGLGGDEMHGGFGADSLAGGIGDDYLFGNTNSDTLAGGQGNDMVDGGDGSDLLDGDDGNDTVLGSGGGDTVLGSRGFDRLDGGGNDDLLDYAGAGLQRVVITVAAARVVKYVGGGVVEVDTIFGFESLIGTGGADKLTGWGQDETFIGGAGNDTIDGGDGFDVARYDVAGAGNVYANMLQGFVVDGLGGRDVLRKSNPTNTTVEMIITGAGADTIVGDGDNNFLRGGAGADSLDGGDGFDTADWWGDADANGDGFGVIVNLGTGPVTLAGWGAETGPIAVAGGSARDASGATDRLANIEYLRGSSYNDRLVGSAVDNFFRGMQGADTIDGGLGNDFAGYRSDSDANGDGFGVIVNLSSNAVNVAAWGSEGALSVAARTGRDGWGGLDTLRDIESALGSNANDLLVAFTREVNFTVAGVNYFGETRSFLRGALGADTLRGTTTVDGATADYRDDLAGVTVDLGAGTAEDGWGFIDTLVNVTGAQGSMFDDRLVAGTTGAFLRGRAGNDTLVGGAGIDNANYTTATVAVVVNLATGVAQDGEGGVDSLTGIENVSGSQYADSLVGTAGANSFFGGRGADTIDGGGGADIANYYASWEDTADVWHRDVLVNLLGGVARDGDGSPGGGSMDRLISIEHAVGSVGADTLLGSTGANSLVGAEGTDSLSGNSGNDTLLGGLGLDTLDGGLGNDRMLGGAGNDLYYANVKQDLVVELAGEGADTVIAAGSFTLGAEIEVLVLGGAGNSTGIGNASNNVILGNAGANALSGGAGNDSLAGNAGADTLNGGAGADTMVGGADADDFAFAKAADSRGTVVDRITGFQVGVDDIAFDNLAGGLFPGLTPTAIDFNGVQVIASAATLAQVYAGITAIAASTGTLELKQVNVSAGAAAGTYVYVNDGTAAVSSATDMLIRVELVGGPLTAADFILF